MIHLLGWVAVILTAARSYDLRSHLDPRGVLEHRAGLPALAYATLMMLSLAVLITVTGAGGGTPTALAAPATFGHTLVPGVWA